MLTLRPAAARGAFELGWLDTRHSFSFGEYVDPDHHHFRALRVLNEDRVAPGQGFGTHGHRDMEILTWVLEGALEHRDSLGTGSVLRPGDAQVMSAGTGIRHSEFNASKTEGVHFLQIWFLPEAQDLPPRYAQTAFTPEALQDRLALIASRDGAEGSVRICQDVKVYATRLSPGVSAALDLAPGHHGWVQVARGAVTLNGVALSAGDGAALSEEPRVTLAAIEASEVLLFDLG